MQPHEKVLKLLPRVEAVEWLYDGLGGKIIPWTLQHGGKSKDPTCQAFFVGRNGKVIERCPDGRAHSASGFSKWLKDAIQTYEATHPRTRLPFVPAEVVRIDDQRGLRCASFDQAREGSKPILLYIGREEGTDRNTQSQVKACRRFEKGALGSKKAAAAARGWVLLRLDLSDREQAAFAKQLGIETAPALLMFLPGSKTPTDLGTKLKGANLAYHLKKHAPR